MPHRRSGVLLLGIVVMTLMTLPAWARRVAVTTSDGRTLRGEVVTQSKDSITLKIAGVNLAIKRSKIASIKDLPSISQLYERRRAKLKDADLDGRYRLAYFLYQHHRDELAIKELTSLARRFPKSDKVAVLREMVESRLHAATQPTRHATNQPRWPVPLDKRLTNKQIQTIKVYEIDLSTQPQVIVPQQTIDRFLHEYAIKRGVKISPSDRQTFLHLDGYKQLELMFHARARDLYSQVKVLGDPPAMRKFRSLIEPGYLLNYCGTTRCHGGFKPAGGLYLFRGEPESTRTAYTNFYILSQYQSQKGRMIDRNSPRNSLFFQYGLPRGAAKTPHPKVPGWRPYFIGDDTPGTQNVLDFIQSLYTPKPEYGIKYAPPLPGKSSSASQPKTEPTQAK